VKPYGSLCGRPRRYQLPTRVEQVPVGDRVTVTVTGEGTDVRFTAAPAVQVGNRTSKAGSL
jgi:hypothetical protein